MALSAGDSARVALIPSIFFLVPPLFLEFLNIFLLVNLCFRLVRRVPFSCAPKRKEPKRRVPLCHGLRLPSSRRGADGSRSHGVLPCLALIGTSLCRCPYRPVAPQHDMKGVAHTCRCHERGDAGDPSRRDHPRTDVAEQVSCFQAIWPGWPDERLCARDGALARPPETGQLRGHPLRGIVIPG